MHGDTHKLFSLQHQPKKSWQPFSGTKRRPLIKFLPQGHTINGVVYCATRQAIQNKQRRILMQGVCFLCNNAHLQTAHGTQERLQSFKWQTLSHPSNCPDLRARGDDNVVETASGRLLRQYKNGHFQVHQMYSRALCRKVIVML